jgi:hypothetical protein
LPLKVSLGLVEVWVVVLGAHPFSFLKALIAEFDGAGNVVNNFFFLGFELPRCFEPGQFVASPVVRNVFQQLRSFQWIHRHHKMPPSLQL